MFKLIDQWVEPGTDPTLLFVINTVCCIHIFAFVMYWLLLARDLVKGTDSAYPYKINQQAEAKKEK